MNILETIKAVLKAEMNKNFDHVTENTTFEEMNLDSLDMIEIIMSIEEKFGIEINDEEVEGMKSFGDAVAYVESKMS